VDAALTFFDYFFVFPPAKLGGQEDKKVIRVWGKAPINNNPNSVHQLFHDQK